ncbi:MAG: YeeE/YedE family protein [Deltaproteobacteria bacterium]|nr:YeeE/YedE family protein [Deltaproteobacteria bacterium]
MHNFTPLSGLIGGVLIGIAASGLLFVNGRIAGISNIFGSLIPPSGGDAGWRLAFVAGLLSGGLVLVFGYPEAFGQRPPASLSVLAAAGLLVGFGASVGNGCTSGHGVCGLARRSPRSLLAVATFMTTGAATVYVVNHLLG